jgi:hypothetical protein
VTFFVLFLTLALGATAQQEPAGRGRGRGSPPQPQQKQGVEYLAGTWTFTWTGRESPVTAGPREGTAVFTRRGTSGLDVRIEGKVADSGSAFQERAAMDWDEAKKTLTIKETLGGGIELTGSGDWSSPLSIRYESLPAKAGSQSVRVRRVYTILSAQSFSIAEEISIDGAAYQRLGNGLYTKAP